MGDVVSLVEKAAEAISEDDARRMEQKLRTASFDLTDFLQQFKMLKRMGPLENILGMIPGMDKLKGSSVDENQLKRVEAIILSMTPQERTRPDILNARRRQRIARGSGVSVSEVNNLILRFNQMRKMMKNMGAMKNSWAAPVPDYPSEPQQCSPTTKKSISKHTITYGSSNPTPPRRR
jgi:signal recognition particle subunit SRP54